jgi:hypothetical protein
MGSQNPSSSARVIVSSDPGDNPWDLGPRRNWTQVMGGKIWDWFLPIRGSQGDGIRFDYNERLLMKLRTRAKEVIRNQSRQATTNSHSVAVEEEEKGESTVVEPDPHV